MTDRRGFGSRSSDRRTADRRTADRVALEAGIRFLRAGDSQVLTGELLDASTAGLRLVLDLPLALGEKLLVEVRGEDDRCFNMTAEAVWVEERVDGRHRVGCELRVDLTPRQLLILKKLATAHSASR